MVDAQTWTPRGAGRTGAHRPADPAPAVPDPYATAGELTDRLLGAAQAADWLDAFLHCAGLGQLVEDRLRGTGSPLRRLLGPPERRRGAARPLCRLLDLLTSLARHLLPGRRRLARWGRATARLAETLAALVAAPETVTAEERAALPGAVRRVAEGPAGTRALRGELLRQPACFTSFEQHPADLVELARRFGRQSLPGERPSSERPPAAYPPGGRPLLVLGVRTSGSYLAPLAAAALRAQGHRTVTVATTRPGGPLLPGRRPELRRLRRDGGAVLLLADPAAAEESLAPVAARLERAGFPPAAVVPLLALPQEPARIPEALRRHPFVLLPAADWRVLALLRPAALAEAVAATLPTGQRLVGVTADVLPPFSRWSARSVPLAARVVQSNGRIGILALTAEWAGIGCFGRHRLAVAQALAGLVPRVYGFEDGVLLRDRLPGEGALDDPRPASAVVARYLAARQDRLAVPADRSLDLAGRQPAWETAAELLAPALGRTAPVARPLLLDPLARTLLTAPHPCAVDGRTAPRCWAGDGAGGWAKTDWAGNAFGQRAPVGYDAAYDLAGAALDTPEAEDELLARYRRLTGEDVPAARWCLLLLVQAWNQLRMVRAGALPPCVAERARQRQVAAVRRFLADTLLGGLGGLGGLDAEPEGPCCVLELDGVLETEALGFPAGSPQSLLALRALRAHGYRTLLATGRSLPEVRDRCAAYRLAGGVAEYGCVGYQAATGATLALLPATPREAGDGGLARRLAARPGISVDLRYLWCVRASADSGGRPTALADEVVACELAELARSAPGVRFTVVQGAAGTDFVPAGPDLAGGVRDLLARLGDPVGVPLLAVAAAGGAGAGGVADLRLAASVVHGAVVRGADFRGADGRDVAGRGPTQAARAAGVRVMRHSAQAGLSEAVAGLLGHRPGTYSVCRPPMVPDSARPLLALLAVPEAGPAGMPRRLARLAREVAGRRRRPGAAAGPGEEP